jgi:hypothetical protein
VRPVTSTGPDPFMAKDLRLIAERREATVSGRAWTM